MTCPYLKRNKMQRTTNIMQQQPGDTSFSLPPSHESALASGSGNGNGLGSTPLTAVAEAKGCGLQAKHGRERFKSSLSLALEKGSNKKIE